MRKHVFLVQNNAFLYKVNQIFTIEHLFIQMINKSEAKNDIQNK